MKAHYRILFAVCLVVGGCATTPQPAAGPDLIRDATIKDIMDSMVDPSADYLFEATATIADENGIVEKAPQNDEEWAEVRHRLIALMEAPNLMVMDGRRVARPGEKAEYPEVELNPEEIQKLIDGDRNLFISHARDLQDAAMGALNAVDAKDRNALFDASTKIDEACEKCHLEYWYPSQKQALSK